MARSNSPIITDKAQRGLNLSLSRRQAMKTKPHSLISQINPTRSTILLSLFISYLHVSGNHVPIIRRNHCIYATLVFVCHSVWVVYGLLVGVSLKPTDQTPPIQSNKYQCRIDTVISPDGVHMVARNI